MLTYLAGAATPLLILGLAHAELVRRSRARHPHEGRAP